MSDIEERQVKKVFDMKKSGQKIKTLREKSGKTLEEVAMDLGITVSSYRKYEAGIRIPRDELKEKIANYFNRSVAFIFFNH